MHTDMPHAHEGVCYDVVLTESRYLQEITLMNFFLFSLFLF